MAFSAAPASRLMRATTVAERPVWICASSCWSLAVLASMSRISISAARMPAWASAAPPLVAVQAACHLAGSMLPRWTSWLAVVGMSRPMVAMKSSCTCSEATRSSAAWRAVLQVDDFGLQLALLLADGGVGVERLRLDRADDDVLAALPAHPHRFRKRLAGRLSMTRVVAPAGRLTSTTRVTSARSGKTVTALIGAVTGRSAANSWPQGTRMVNRDSRPKRVDMVRSPGWLIAGTRFAPRST